MSPPHCCDPAFTPDPHTLPSPLTHTPSLHPCPDYHLPCLPPGLPAPRRSVPARVMMRWRHVGSWVSVEDEGGGAGGGIKEGRRGISGTNGSFHSPCSLPCHAILCAVKGPHPCSVLCRRPTRAACCVLCRGPHSVATPCSAPAAPSLDPGAAGPASRTQAGSMILGQLGLSLYSIGG